MSEIKKFSLDRIDFKTAMDWTEEAVGKSAKKIVVGLTGGILKPNYLLPGELLEDKKKKVEHDSDYYCGVIDVEEAVTELCV